METKDITGLHVAQEKARLPPKIPAQRSQTSMPVETEEVFEEATTEVYSDMKMMPVQTAMPVISHSSNCYASD